MLHEWFLDGHDISQKDLAEAIGDFDQGTLSRLCSADHHILIGEKTRRKHMRKILNGLYRLNRPLSLEQANALLDAAVPGDVLDEGNEEDAILIEKLKARIPKPKRLTRHQTLLFGRDETIEDICNELLDRQVHLLTLVGPSGIGKTELALQVESQFRKGSHIHTIFIELEKIEEPTLVFPTIARSLELGVPEHSPLEHLIEYLSEQHRLIILDNFEQFEKFPEVKEDLVKLVKACPKIKVLVTCLRRLDVHGEKVFNVDPLRVPDPKKISSVKDLLAYPATHLFIGRAKINKRDFAIADEDASTIAEICVALDGIPGAIEITAPDLTMSSPKELLQDVKEQLLDMRSRALVGTPKRQQTHKAMIKYSSDRFEPEEEQLFRRLSVFAGGFTRQAAEEVCMITGEKPLHVRQWLKSLQNWHLIIRREQDGDSRFEMLRAYRLFGYEKLKSIGEQEVFRRQHRDFYLKMVNEAEREFFGKEQYIWLKRMEDELANLEPALSWCLRETDGVEIGLYLASALLWFWYLNGHWYEGRYWLKKLLEQHPPSQHSAPRAKALYAAGFLAFYQSDFQDARNQLEESLVIFKELGDDEGIAFAQVIYAFVQYEKYKDITKMVSLLNNSIELMRKINHEWGEAFALIFLGYGINRQGNREEARTLFERSQHLFQEVGDDHGYYWSFLNQGDVALFEEQYEEAERQYRKSLDGFEKIRDLLGQAWVRCCIGDVMLYKRNYQEAAQCFARSIEQSQRLGDKIGIHGCYLGIAELLKRVGKLKEAASIIGATHTLFRGFNATQLLILRPVIRSSRYDTLKDYLQAKLDEDSFTKAQHEGRTQTVGGAVKYAQMQLAVLFPSNAK